jgi:hypothetical protein
VRAQSPTSCRARYNYLSSFLFSFGSCPHVGPLNLNNNCASSSCRTGGCSGLPCTLKSYTDSGGSYTASGGNCCDAGVSKEPSCVYGSYRCSGQTVQRCLGNYPHSWQNQGTCTAAYPCQELTCNSGAAWASSTSCACGRSSAAHACKSSCGSGKWCLPSSGLRTCLNVDACGADRDVLNPVSPRGTCSDRAAPLTG